MLILVVLALGLFANLGATAAQYNFSYSTGTYTALSGATALSTITSDDQGWNIALPWNFYFDGTSYANVRLSQNGWLAFYNGAGPTWATAFGNSIAGTTILAPAVCPLWDDLYYNTSIPAVNSWKSSGEAPNRTLTFEWKNALWQSAGPDVNMQVQLVETSWVVKIVYGTLATASGKSASIGILDGAGGSGRYLSVTPATTPTASSTAPNDAVAVNTYLTGGLTYTFTPSVTSPNCILVSPAAAANGVDVNTAFTWVNGGWGTTSMSISIGTNVDADNVVPLTDRGLLTTFTPASPLQPNTAYNWKVVPYAGATPYTAATGSFTTSPAAAMVSPAASASNVLTVPTFTWTGTGTITGYRIYIGTDSPPTSFADGTDVGLVTSWSPPTALATSTTYNWRVVPYNASGAGIIPTAISFGTTSAVALAGAKTINPLGAAADPNYKTFTAAITALNAGGVGAGGVYFTVTSNTNYGPGSSNPESNPIPAITASGTAANPIVFQSDYASSNPVIVPVHSGTTDYGIKISGGDYITFDGINVNGSATAVEYGYWLVGAAADGCKNNTIKNLTVTLSNATALSKCIYMTSAATSVAGTNDNNKFTQVTLSGALYGYHIVGSSTLANYDIGNEIGVASRINPTITNVKGYNIYTSYQKNEKIFNQDITFVAGQTNYGIYTYYTSGTLDIYNNNIIGCSNATSAQYGLDIQYCSYDNVSAANIHDNVIRSFTSTSGAQYGIYTYYGYAHNIYSNSVYSFSASGASTIWGIYTYYNNPQIYSNNVYTIAGGTSAVYGVYAYNTSYYTPYPACNVYQNNIYDISTTGANVYGLALYGNSSSYALNAYRNKIYNIRMTGTGAQLVYGIRANSGTMNIYNNLIYDCKAPAAGTVGSPNVRALSLDGGTTANAYFNTVYLDNQTGSGANVQSAALYLAGVTTATFNNNIFVNTSRTGGTGRAAVIWKSASFTSGNIASSTGRNLYYIDTPTTLRRNFAFDGTNEYLSLAAYQAIASYAPRDAAAYTEVVPFTSGVSPYNLTINSTYPSTNRTYIEGAGIPITGITKDYTDATRSTTSPDLGAYEGNYAPIDAVPGLATYTAPATSGTNIAINAPFTWTAPTSGGIPTHYHFYLGTSTGSYGVVNGDSIPNGLTYTPASPLLNYQQYFWKVVPANATGEASGPLEWSFTTVKAPLTGTLSISDTGTPDYATFTLAINDLAIRGVGSSGVIFNVTSGSVFTENPPAITFNGSLTQQVVFQKSGESANPIIKAGTTATGSTDAILTFTGCNYVTFNGIDLSENSANTTAATKMEYGLWVKNASATDGAKYNTFKNGKITMDRTNTNLTYGVYQYISSPSSDAGTSSYNKYQYVTIENSFRGMNFYGSISWFDTANEISNCIIGSATTANDIGYTANTGYIYGISVTTQKDISIFSNEVRNVSSNNATYSAVGIDLNGLLGTANVYNNKVHDISFLPTSTASVSVQGIYAGVSTLTGTHTANIYNNMVYNLNHGFTGTAVNTNAMYGIYLGTTNTTNTYNVDFNSVRITGPTNASSNCFAIAGAANGINKVRNNIFANLTANQTTSKHAAWYSPTAALIGSAGSISNRNVLYVLNATNGFIGRAGANDYALLGAWTTAMSSDANSRPTDPMFVVGSDLHIQSSVATPVESNGSWFGGTISWMTTDIDGLTRTTTESVGPPKTGPDIGADEGVFLAEALCTTPAAQPTAAGNWLVPASTSISGSFSASDAGGYLVVRHNSATLGATPLEQEYYAVNDTLGAGLGTVVSAGSSTTFNATSLDPSTTYYFTIFAYNFAGLEGPKYLTSNVAQGGIAPLTGNIQTLPTAPGNPSPFTVAATPGSYSSIDFTVDCVNPIMVIWGLTQNWGTPQSNVTYLVGDPVTVGGGGGTVLFIGNASELTSHTGLMGNTTYYYKAFAYLTSGIYKVYSAGVAPAGVTTPRPANPTFTASAVSASQINLSATVTTSPIIIAWNSVNTFGTPDPATTYSVGNTIPSGGGTVMYTGAVGTAIPHSGLPSSTLYYYKVWSLEVTGSVNTYSTGATANATTWAEPVALTYTQNFDSVTTPALPVGWAKVGTSGSASTQTSSPNSAPNCMYIYGSGVTTTVMMRPVTTAVGTRITIKFWGRGNLTAGEAIQIGYLINPSDAGSFQLIEPKTMASLIYAQYTVNHTTNADPMVYAVRHPGVLGNSCLLDDFILEVAPTTPSAPSLPSPVASPAATGVGLFANLSWTNNGYVTRNDIYFSTTQALVNGMDPTVKVGSNQALPLDSFDLPELAPLTEYFWRVVSKNDGTDTAIGDVWSFTTMADPSVALPFTEDFQVASPFPATGWTRWSGILANPSSITTTTSGWVSDNWCNIASNPDLAARLNIFSTSKYWLVTPMLNLPADSKLMFKVSLGEYANYAPPDSAQTDDKFIVLVGDGVTWTPTNVLREWNQTGSSYRYRSIPYTGANYIIPLTGITGRRYIAFYGESTASGDDNDLMINDVKVYTGNYDDYGISNFAIAPTIYNFVGTPLTYSFTVTNNGEVTTGKVVSIKANTVEIDTVNVETLAIGASRTLTREYTPSTAGIFTLTANLTADANTANDADTLANVEIFNAGFLAQGFEGTFLPNKWIKWGVPYWTQGTTGYDGSKAAKVSLLAGSTGSRIATPRLNIATNDSLTFWMKVSSISQTLQIKYNATADTTTALWTNLGSPIALTTPNVYVRKAIDLTSLNGQQLRFAFEALANGVAGDVYLDKVLGPIIYIPATPPGVVQMVGPADRVININPRSVVLDWDVPLSGGDPELYTVYIGTVNDTTLVDVGIYREVIVPTTQHQPYTGAGIPGSYLMNYSTNYYWMVVPWNANGSPHLHDCPIYKLTTQPAPLAGAKTIDPAGSGVNNYTTFKAAIDSLNAWGVGEGGVTFTVAAGTYTENLPAITANGTLADQITFVGAGGSRTKPIVRPLAGIGPVTDPPIPPDAILTLKGCDYVTFDNIAFEENPVSADPLTKMEYGIYIINNGATDGAQHNTIKNCTISRAAHEIGTRGIYQIATGVTTAAGTQSYNKFYNNAITNWSYGYLLTGTSTSEAVYDTGVEVGISAGTASISGCIQGVNYSNQAGFKVFNQTITMLGGATPTATEYGIYCGTGTYNTVEIYSNNITVAVQVTGTVSTNGIYVSSGKTASIHDNVIANISSTYTSGTFYGIWLSAGATGQTNDIYNNSIHDISGTMSSMYPLYVTASYLNNVYSNTVYNITNTYSFGSIYGFYVGASGATNSVHDNIVRDITGSYTIYAFYLNYGTQTAYNNEIYNITGVGSYAVYGLYTYYATDHTIYGNTIRNLTSASSLYGVDLNSGYITKFYGNYVYTLTSSAGTVYGVYVYDYNYSTSRCNVYKNKVYDLSYTGTSTSVVYGIYTSGYSYSNYSIYNNMLYNLRAATGTATAASPQIVGIYTGAGLAINLWNNSVYLNATYTGTGTTFSSAALYLSSGTTVDLKNNIFDNKSAVGTTGRAVAFWKGAAGFSNLSATTNKNIYYAGTPGTKNLIFYDGTNSKETIDDYMTLNTGKDQSSYSEDVPFAGLSRTIDLHINPAVATAVEGNALVIANTLPIPSVTDDIDSETRNATTPDIGADEGTFTALAPVIAPLAQPTNLELVPASTSISGSFTASDAESYLVIRHTTTTLGATPIDLKKYVVTDTLGASGTVIAKGTAISFSTTGLPNATTYYFTIFAYNSIGTGGPLYLKTGPLTGFKATLPAPPSNPSVFAATTASTTQINLTATASSGNQILVAWSSTEVFGTPLSNVDYSSNPAIAGGGTVIYIGAATGLTNHEGLTSGTTYYYKAFSFVTSDGYKVYSAGLARNATAAAIMPIVQNFDAVTTPAMPSGWKVIDNNGDAVTWKSSTTTPNTSPNCLNIGYHLTNPLDDWSVAPPVVLTAGVPTKIQFYYRAVLSSYTEKLAVRYGSSPDPSSMTNQIFVNNSFTTTTYTKGTAEFTPATSGVYYIGWYAFSNANQDGICVDDVVIYTGSWDDYAVSALAITPLYKFVGTPVTVSFRATNNGDVTTGKQAYLRVNADIVATMSLGTLAQSAYKDTSFTYTFTSAGTDSVSVLLDTDQVVSNNKVTLTNQVVYAADQLAEGFEGDFAPSRWLKWGRTGQNLWVQGTTTPLDGTKNAQLVLANTTNTGSYLATPLLDIRTGNTFKFWAKPSTAGRQIQIKYSAGSDTLTSAWTNLGTGTTNLFTLNTTTAYTEYTVDLSSIASARGIYRLAFNGLPNGSTGTIYLDKVVGPQKYIPTTAPGPVVLTAPTNGITEVNPRTVVLDWNEPMEGGTATSYNVYVSNNLSNMTGQHTFSVPATTTQLTPYTYSTPVLLDYGTKWYWTVQPVGAYGSPALSSCPIDTLTTKSQLQVGVTSPLELGSAYPGSARTVSIVLSNVGPTTLTYSTTGSSPEFSYSTITTIPADSTRTLNVTFTAPLTLGAYTGTARFNVTNPGSYYTDIIVHATIEPVIQVGTGTSDLSLPIDPWMGYTYSQSIYPASELGVSNKRITKLYYYWSPIVGFPTDLTNGSQIDDLWEIWMGHTDLTQFPSSSPTFLPVSGMTKVYSGSVPLTATAGWIELTLTTPFTYNGTQNLVIAVDENEPGYDDNTSIFYSTATTGERRSMVVNADSYNPDPLTPPTSIGSYSFYGTKEGYPNIKLSLTDPPPPTYSIAPSTWNFADVVQYTDSPAKTFTISNTGTGSFDVTSVTVEGTNASEFSVVATGLTATVASTPYTFTVTMQPLTTGAKSCSLKVIESLGGAHYYELLGNCVPEPVGIPVNLAATVSNNNNVALSWGMNTGLSAPPWIHWDNGTNGANYGYDSISYGNADTLDVAVKFTTTDLTNYAGYKLRKIKFYTQGVGTFKACVWTGSDAGLTPTALVRDQAFTVTASAWNEIELVSPYTITGSDAIWIGFNVIYSAASYPMGADSGPRVIDKGSLYSFNNGDWTQLLPAPPEMNDRNWNIQCYIDNLPARGVVDAPELSTPVRIFNGSNSGQLVAQMNPRDAQTTQNSRSLTGFNIYRDTVQLNTSLITAYNYQDYEVANGSHAYYVKAVYTSGLSNPSNTATVNIAAPAALTLPFSENWSSGALATNNWYTTTGNWQPSTIDGNSAPSVIFSKSPIQNNYSINLNSWQINAVGTANLKLKYDVKLLNLSTATLEQLAVEVYSGVSWVQVDNLTNAGGNIDWTSKSIDISSLVGNSIFKIRFIAHGVNSNNITKWAIDNIKVEQIVAPNSPVPVPTLTVDNNVEISWAPVLGASSYKVYKSTVFLAAFPSEWTHFDTVTSPTSLTYTVGEDLYMWFRVVAVSADREVTIEHTVSPVKKAPVIKAKN